MTFEEQTIGSLHVLVGGASSAPPLIYLHGFPDHPPTALPFLTELAKTRRVVAPWLPGYAPSPLTGPFDLALVAGTIVSLIERVADGTVDLVGHDWGAAITYALALRSPHLVRRAVTLAVPHPWTFVRGQRRAAQRRASAYWALFQLPGAGYLAPRMTDALWRRWSPGFTVDPAACRERDACLRASMPSPLGYYRAALRPALRDLWMLRAPIAAPVLQLHGVQDGCILRETVEIDDAELFAQRERVMIEGVGHFLHVEDPLGVADRIQRFLAVR